MRSFLPFTLFSLWIDQTRSNGNCREPYAWVSPAPAAVGSASSAPSAGPNNEPTPGAPQLSTLLTSTAAFEWQALHRNRDRGAPRSTLEIHPAASF